MADISASAVFSLRSRTGVSILLCKKALEEANGNEEQAIEILRKQGAAQAAKKAGREQKEGLVFLTEKEGKAALFRLDCETDFVARNNDFKEAGNSFCLTLLNEGEAALKAKTDADIPALVQKLGENISAGESYLFQGSVLGSYLHSNSKIGVIISLEGGDKEKARSVAMHAAAMNPGYISPDEVKEKEIAKEKEIWTEQLKNEGKPQQIFEKILIGKEKKYREDNALLKQEFVKEPGKTVEEYLAGAKVIGYKRLAVE